MISVPLPYLGPRTVAIAPYPGVILISWWYWRGLNRAERSAVLAHELTHHEQQRRDGRLRFLWRWLTDDLWREVYEQKADAVQRRVLEALR